MRRGVVVEAGGISFEQRAGTRFEIGVLPLRRAARVEQSECVIELRTFFTRDRTVAPAGHRDHVLQGEEVVLGMRLRDAVSDVGIGPPVDVRHTPFVAHDLRAVLARRRGGPRAGHERLPRHQPDRGYAHQCQHREANPNRPLFQCTTPLRATD